MKIIRIENNKKFKVILVKLLYRCSICLFLINLYRSKFLKSKETETDRQTERECVWKGERERERKADEDRERSKN